MTEQKAVLLSDRELEILLALVRMNRQGVVLISHLSLSAPYALDLRALNTLGQKLVAALEGAKE